MTVNNWENDQRNIIRSVALYKREIADLHKELKNVYNINEEHRILNGQLREEINELRQQLKESTS